MCYKHCDNCQRPTAVPSWIAEHCKCVNSISKFVAPVVPEWQMIFFLIFFFVAIIISSNEADDVQPEDREGRKIIIVLFYYLNTFFYGWNGESANIRTSNNHVSLFTNQSKAFISEIKSCISCLHFFLSSVFMCDRWSSNIITASDNHGWSGFE